MTGISLEQQSLVFRTVEARLNHADRTTRLANLAEIVASNELGIRDAEPTREVNNHVHTSFSFSPYSPASAAFMARYAGLQAVGSVDHDSIGAAREMVAACRILGIASTVGYELRVHFSATSLQGRKLNNPDSHNIGYIVIHGVPSRAVATVEQFLEPVREARNRRNRVQVENLNTILAQSGIEPLDFDNDVVTLSQAHDGGSITERHILAGLSKRVLSEAGKAGTDGNRSVSGWLHRIFGLTVPDPIAPLIDNADNPHRLYDLLGALKSSFLPRFFVQPDEFECMSVSSAVDFATSVGAIPCYAYLGDVTESPTGDKKAEKFEDGFLDELFMEVKRLGFLGLTYMPPRNSREQLLRVINLCRTHDLIQISGVDINSSRQLFTCPEIMDPDYRHLLDTTWALIAHEKLSSSDPKFGLFHPENPWRTLSLSDRIATFSRFGADMDPFLLDGASELVRHTS